MDLYTETQIAPQSVFKILFFNNISYIFLFLARFPYFEENKWRLIRPPCSLCICTPLNS
jgi:hypothetical protein